MISIWRFVYRYSYKTGPRLKGMGNWKWIWLVKEYFNHKKFWMVVQNGEWKKNTKWALKSEISLHPIAYILSIVDIFTIYLKRAYWCIPIFLILDKFVKHFWLLINVLYYSSFILFSFFESYYFTFYFPYHCVQYL